MTDKQIENIVHLLNYGIITMDQAQKLLGFNPRLDEFNKQLQQLVEEQNE